MKVNQNPSVPTQVQESSYIKDGTSNTLQIAEEAKTARPFAKDSFESATAPSHDGSGKTGAHQGFSSKFEDILVSSAAGKDRDDDSSSQVTGGWDVKQNPKG